MFYASIKFTSVIVNILAREPDPLANNYDYVRNLLLKRFKMSLEEFKQKLKSHKKFISASRHDQAFELRNSFEKWINGLEFFNFEDLRIIIDQIK